MRIKFWQKPKAQAPALYLVAESHCGRNGVAVFENGHRVAWGANQGAAMAAYQVARSTSCSA